MTDDLRYPIGKYEPQPFSNKQKELWLLDLRCLPSDLEAAVQNLDAAQLQTPYRENGWTVNQVVHHVADSHLNAYFRFKIALTEDNPTITPYDEKKWAELEDVRKLPVNISLTLLHALHKRLLATIEDLSDAQWERTFFHPDHNRNISLWQLLGLYAWHGKHHIHHILALRERMKW